MGSDDDFASVQMIVDLVNRLFADHRFDAVDSLLKNLEPDALTESEMIAWARGCYPWVRGCGPARGLLPTYTRALGRLAMSAKSRGFKTGFHGLPVPICIKLWLRHD